MALANFTDYVSKVRTAPYQRFPISKIGAVGSTGHPVSWWTGSGIPAAPTAPGGATLCDNTTVGAITARNAATEMRAFIRNMGISQSGGLTAPVTIFLADRLAHMTGINLALTTAQNVLTPAISRYTASTDRLQFAYEVWVASGNGTGGLLTASYTNSAGVAGQVSPGVVVGAGVSAIATFLPFPLASGDVGISSVETVTNSVGTIGSAGTLGVTIYKTLAPFVCFTNLDEINKFDPVERLGGLMPLIKSNACLFFWGYTAGTSVTLTGDVEFFED